MIRAFPGGWDSMSAALGYTRDALENRVYEKRGQTITVDTALQMQSFSGTSLFAEAVAVASGGTFVKVANEEEVGREDLLESFNKIYSEVGRLSSTFQCATEDGVVDPGEKAELERVANQIHAGVERLLAVTFALYCRQPARS